MRNYKKAGQTAEISRRAHPDECTDHLSFTCDQPFYTLI